jgi:hypothetical protein
MVFGGGEIAAVFKLLYLENDKEQNCGYECFVKISASDDNEQLDFGT